ncbi:MAG: hypothetical protein FWC58_10845 [Desulfobulbus sp.]|nr:hypothetical protein [Desulfobulbus sp.]
MQRLSSFRTANAPRQRGAILLITLITLVLMLLSALALIRSFDTSLSMAGNLAFKRDLVIQGERGMAKAIELFADGGALGDAATRNADSSANNYFATAQATNNRGIPTALITKTASAADISDAGAGVEIVYIIDRMCKPTTVDPSREMCIGYEQPAIHGGSSHLSGKKVGQSFQPVYRISVRVSGPRNTQVYLQTTITR